MWHNISTHTTILLLFWSMSGTTRVSRYQKGKTRKVKTNLDLLEQEIMSGNISSIKDLGEHLKSGDQGYHSPYNRQPGKMPPILSLALPM